MRGGGIGVHFCCFWGFAHGLLFRAVFVRSHHLTLHCKLGFWLFRHLDCGFLLHAFDYVLGVLAYVNNQLYGNSKPASDCPV